MAIYFEIHNNEFWVCHTPERGIEYYQHSLDQGKTETIKSVFTVSKDLLRDENELIEEIKFCVGYIEGEYVHFIRNVIETDHEFYFSKDIRFKMNLFWANQNISVLRKIDAIIERDFYVGGNWEEQGGISENTYLELIKKFPKSAELKKYAHYRISNILKEYYPECDKYEEIYEKYMSRKRPPPADQYSSLSFNKKIEYEQFKTAYDEMKVLIENSGVDERVWQEKVHEVLCLLYPQYIFASREIQFLGLDKYKKQPDVLLVDVNGYVDILEIKKADIHLLREHKYRNNFVPSSEFSGAIQQIEKYVFCLNTQEFARDKVKKDLYSQGASQEMDIKIMNPQGMLLLGRSNDFNEQQRNDFELIKRQYRHIVDIMSYDDLLARLHNIVKALEKSVII